MKKLSLILAAILFSIAGVAHAQSSPSFWRLINNSVLTPINPAWSVSSTGGGGGGGSASGTVGPSTVGYLSYFIGSTAVTGSSSLTVSGNELQPQNIDNILYADQYAGGDIGAQVNNAEAAAGGAAATVYIGAGSPTLTTTIVPKSNISIVCSGPSTVINYNDQSVVAILSSASVNLTNFSVQNCTFNGTVISTSTVPTRTKTLSGGATSTVTSAGYAIEIQGSFAPGITPSSTNIVIKNNVFQNIDTLPLYIRGVGGVTDVEHNQFLNNYDVGFVFDQNIIFNDNYIYGSGDNCVSISRGNQNVTAVGNNMNNCAYDGIWLAGYLGTEGIDHFTISNNTISNIGRQGINGSDAVKFGVISGNYINKGYYRGPVDGPEDGDDNGIALRGYPTNGSNNAIIVPTDYVYGVNVTGNTIYQASQSCVYLDAVRDVTVSNNVCISPGTQFLANGSTAITANSTSSNIGVQIPNPSTSQNVRVLNNTVVDERGTPYANLAVWPTTPATMASSSYFNNTIVNGRNANSTGFGINTATPITALDVNGDITDENVKGATCMGTNASGTLIDNSGSCGGGSGGIASSSPYTPGFLPTITSSGRLTNSIVSEVDASFATIARDATATVVVGSSVTTATTTITIGNNANEFLFGWSLTTNNDASMTFNGVPMTKIVTVVGTDTRALALFGLASPATGTHILATSVSSTEALVEVGGTSYSGVSQTTLLDATTTNSNGALISTYPTSLSTRTANDWTIEVFRQSGGTNPSGTVPVAPAVFTSVGPTLFTGMADGGQAIPTPGTSTITINTTNGGTGAFYSVMGAFSPALLSSSSVNLIGVNGYFGVGTTNPLTDVDLEGASSTLFVQCFKTLDHSTSSIVYNWIYSSSTTMIDTAIKPSFCR